MRFYMFRIENKEGFKSQITRRADRFIRLLGHLEIVYPEHKITYIG